MKHPLCRILTNIPRLFLCASACLFLAHAPAHAAIIDTYFGWNYIDISELLGNPSAPNVMELTSISYIGGSGATVLPIPAFGGPYINGMPDRQSGASYSPPTYSVSPNFDGESTRTINQPLPIDWVPAGVAAAWGTSPFPTIGITDLSTDYGDYNFASSMQPNPVNYYVVGLIPFGPDTELLSLLAAPQGDIYDALLGSPGSGNPKIYALDLGTSPGSMGKGDEILVTFAAATVPLPAAVWLLLTGLLGLIGIARCRKNNT